MSARKPIVIDFDGELVMAPYFARILKARDERLERETENLTPKPQKAPQVRPKRRINTPRPSRTRKPY